MSGHGRARRWAVLAALVAVLCALPAVVGALPADDADVPAADLRDEILGSAGVGFSGYAISAGGLALPVSDQLPAVADLLSDRLQLRVWWRGEDEHRVDVLTTTGETGVHTDPAGTWTWEFESATAERTQPAPLALPAPPDLVPAALGRRLLSEGRRRRAVAHRCAPGGRARRAGVCGWSRPPPRRPWRGSTSGPTPRPACRSPWRSSPTVPPSPRWTPASSTSTWLGPRPPSSPSPRRRAPASGRGPMPAGCWRRPAAGCPPAPLPDTLAGLPRRALAGAPAAVGIYGSGGDAAGGGAGAGPAGLRSARHARRRSGRGRRRARHPVAAGPLGLMLVEPPGSGAYVLTGTVTLDALADAAAALGGVPA
jgi:hypothetical protein